MSVSDSSQQTVDRARVGTAFSGSPEVDQAGGERQVLRPGFYRPSYGRRQSERLSGERDALAQPAVGPASEVLRPELPSPDERGSSGVDAELGENVVEVLRQSPLRISTRSTHRWTECWNQSELGQREAIDFDVAVRHVCASEEVRGA